MKILHDCPISFPGLFGDWEFTVPSKALDIGNGVYWYGILIMLGTVIATLVCMRERKKYGISEDNLLDCILWGVPCGILGARIYYVLFYLDLFRDGDGKFVWRQAIAIWDGGLAIYGAVIAAAIVTLIVSRRERFKLFAMTDVIVIGFFIGQAVGRWGNFMNREAFGTETTLPWRMQLITTNGQPVCVHPTFLYESLWNVVGLILLLTIVAKARHFDGENSCFYLLWYGIGRFWIEGLRTDSLYLFNWQLFGEPIRVSQALSAVMILAAAVLLYWNLVRHPHDPAELYVNQLAAAQAESEAAESTQEEATP